jgi:FAD/FMN-containing dehydrogenase
VGFRDVEYVMAIQAAWARSFFDSVHPLSSGSGYINFQTEDEDRVRQAYPAAVYERLVRVKNCYDPENLLRLNKNIRPTVESRPFVTAPAAASD